MENDEIEDALIAARAFVIGGDIHRRHNADRVLRRVERALKLRAQEVSVDDRTWHDRTGRAV